MSLNQYIALTRDESTGLAITVTAPETSLARDCVFLLAQEPVNIQGNFDGLLFNVQWTKIRMDNTVPAHTLQLEGVTEEGEHRSLKVGSLSAGFYGTGPQDTVKALVALGVNTGKHLETVLYRPNAGKEWQQSLYTNEDLMPQ